MVQVSRWDRLKDPLGVIIGFVDYIAPNVDAHLVLAGPSTESVADDPEGAGILQDVNNTWASLPDRHTPASAPRVAADGGHRGERGDRQRAAATR